MRDKKNVDLLGSIWIENPLFTMLLGLCPALAVTTTAFNGVCMGLITTCVMMLTNLFVSLLRPVLPEKNRLPIIMAVSAIFATLAQILVKAFVPSLIEAYGIFLPLVAVNALVLNRADVFATQNSPFAAMNDGLVMGLGYLCALTGISLVREFLGYGSLFGIEILGGHPLLIATMPAGGFIVVGLLMGIGNAIVKKQSNKKEGESA